MALKKVICRFKGHKPRKDKLRCIRCNSKLYRVVLKFSGSLAYEMKVSTREEAETYASTLRTLMYIFNIPGQVEVES